MNEKDTRRLLRRWDPAADSEPPSEELYASLRARLAAGEEPVHPPAGGWLVGHRRLAAVAVAGALLVAVILLRPERFRGGKGLEPGAPVAATAGESADVQVVYTASNGVRIYWRVPAPPSSRL